MWEFLINIHLLMYFAELLSYNKQNNNNLSGVRFSVVLELFIDVLLIFLFKN